jgi:hypothetical protein
MAYKFRCNTCNTVFTSEKRSAVCTRHTSRDHSASFIGEVLETAVDVATAYFMVDVAADVIGGVGSMIGGLFD